VDRKILDLARPADIPAVLGGLAPDIIINPAAYTAVDKAEEEPDLARTVNAVAPGAMARWAAARDVPLIHLSSDYVFDGSGDQPWREDDETRPLSVYGETKLAGEKAVRRALGSHLVVRTSWIYASKGQNFVRTIARLADESRELRIVADQIGAPTPAALIADALARMVEGDPKTIADRFAAAQGLVHFAASGATSWHGHCPGVTGTGSPARS